jgi:hypothetical protein
MVSDAVRFIFVDDGHFESPGGENFVERWQRQLSPLHFCSTLKSVR